MSDLESAISEWRQRMLSAGVKDTDVLHELELHLRDDIAREMRAGLSALEAFRLAVQNLGEPSALRKEFARARSPRRMIWLRRLRMALTRLPGPRAFPTFLSPAALDTLGAGAAEAHNFHHDFVGTEHVLLGLLKSDADGCTRLLRELGVDAGLVRREIEKVVGPGLENQSLRTLPHTPRVKKALELAGAEARSLGKSQVGPEHILLGLLREGGGVAGLILRGLGINIESARDAIRLNSDGGK